MMRHNRMLRDVVSCCCLSLVIGCGRTGPPVIDVEGTITKDGIPVSNAVVQFHPDKGRPSACRTDAEGYYRPEFSDQVPYGVMPGTAKVSLQVTQERIDEPINLNDTSKYHPEMREIIRYFGNWNSTPLEVEVSAENDQIDIELSDYWPEETETTEQ